MTLRLILDCATQSTSVTLAANDHVLATATARGRPLQTLHPGIQWVLDSAQKSLADVEGIGVVLGPGSWTGLQVSISTAKTFAQLLGKPVYGLSYLEALSGSCLDYGGFVCPMMDARHDRVYAGVYKTSHCQVRTIVEGKQWQLNELVKELNNLTEPVLLVGDAAKLYRSRLEPVLGAAAHFGQVAEPSAQSIAYLTARQKGVLPDSEAFHSITPIYMQPEGSGPRPYRGAK